MSHGVGSRWHRLPLACVSWTARWVPPVQRTAKLRQTEERGGVFSSLAALRVHWESIVGFFSSSCSAVGRALGKTLLPEDSVIQHIIFPSAGVRQPSVSPFRRYINATHAPSLYLPFLSAVPFWGFFLFKRKLSGSWAIQYCFVLFGCETI